MGVRLPCGAVLPVEHERNAGGHCVGCPEPKAWPRADHLALAGRDQGRFNGLVGGCRLVALSGDGGVLARLTEKKRLVVTRLEAGAVLLDHTEGQKFTALALDEQGTALAAVGEREVLEWRAEPGTGCLRLVSAHSLAWAHTAFFGADGALRALSRGRALLGGGLAANVEIWPSFPRDNETVWALSLSPDGQLLAALIGSTKGAHAEAFLARRVGARFVQARRARLSGFKAGWLSDDARWLAWTDHEPGVRLHDLEGDAPRGRAGCSPEGAVTEGRFGEGLLWVCVRKEGICPLPLSVFPGPRQAPTPLPSLELAPEGEAALPPQPPRNNGPGGRPPAMAEHLAADARATGPLFDASS